jgi:hypothetical protein
MLTDTFLDAINEIDRYLKEFGDTYTEDPELHVRILGVRNDMLDLVRILNTPPDDYTIAQTQPSKLSKLADIYSKKLKK